MRPHRNRSVIVCRRLAPASGSSPYEGGVEEREYAYIFEYLLRSNGLANLGAVYPQTHPQINGGQNN